MERYEIVSKLEKSYTPVNGVISEKYKLLCVLCGLPLSKSAAKGDGTVLYVRNGICLSGRHYLIHRNKGFRPLNKNHLKWLDECIEGLCV